MGDGTQTGVAGLFGLLGFGADGAPGWLDNYETICRSLGNAVIAAQLFETTVRIAAPSLAADGTDDVAARAELDKGLSQNLHRAIGDLGSTHPDLVEGLHRGRLRRNSIVHDGLIRVLVAIATGTAPALVQELDASADELMEDANALMGAVWPMSHGSPVSRTWIATLRPPD